MIKYILVYSLGYDHVFFEKQYEYYSPEFYDSYLFDSFIDCYKQLEIELNKKEEIYEDNIRKLNGFGIFKVILDKEIEFTKEFDDFIDLIKVDNFEDELLKTKLEII